FLLWSSPSGNDSIGGAYLADPAAWLTPSDSHRTQHVGFDPLLHKLAVYDSVDLYASHAHFLSYWWKPLKRSFVREPIVLSDDHQVALGDEELWHRLEHEGDQIGGKEVLEGLAASHGSRDRQATHMQNTVCGTQVVDNIHVALIALLLPAQR